MTRRKLIVQIVISLLAAIGAVFLVGLYLMFAMGCGWSSDCSKYGNYILGALVIGFFAALFFCFRAIFRLLTFGLNEENIGDADSSVDSD